MITFYYLYCNSQSPRTTTQTERVVTMQDVSRWSEDKQVMVKEQHARLETTTACIRR